MNISYRKDQIFYIYHSSIDIVGDGQVGVTEAVGGGDDGEHVHTELTVRFWESWGNLEWMMSKMVYSLRNYSLSRQISFAFLC